MDARTYICAKGFCLQHYDRSHRRISNYNWIKLRTSTEEYIKIINQIANDIINIDTCLNGKCHETMNKTVSLEDTEKQDVIEKKCVYCKHPKLTKYKHIHFVKETTKFTEENIHKNKKRYEPIESVFTKIDEISKNNSKQIKQEEFSNAPRSKILQSNCYRMTYSDINYLRSNRAIFYFDRGIRGKQSFINSMYPLEHHPKHKDLIVIDDIVFTSPCKCDSTKQHQKMFPHYRVTCAEGLTCPVRFNDIEKEVHISNKNAISMFLNTPRKMLIRYW